MNLRPLLLLTVLTACGRKADLVIEGGSVWTGLSTGRGQPGAVAIADGKILAVGDSAEIARYVGSKTEILWANGGLVLPGLADAHTHFIDGGFQLASVNLRDAKTPQEFVRRLKEYAAHLKPGEWILGGDWDHTLWPGAPLPRHAWIDSVTPANPVFISRVDGHMALANGAAMRAAKITRDTPAPVGGEIPRDARGEPIGIFKDNAEDLIGRAIPAPSPEQRDSALARALAFAASLGVTATGHMSASWADLASYKRLERAGRMTLRSRQRAKGRRRGRLGAHRRRQRLHGRLGGLTHRLLLRPILRLGGLSRVDAAAGVGHARLGWRSRFGGSANRRARHRRPRQRDHSRDLRQRRARAWRARPAASRRACAAPARRGHRALRPAARRAVDATVSRDRRRPLADAAHRTRAHQDDVCLPHAARFRRAARLWIRLDRGAARSDARRLRRGHEADPGRSQSRWLGARAEDHRR